MLNRKKICITVLLVLFCVVMFGYVIVTVHRGNDAFNVIETKLRHMHLGLSKRTKLYVLSLSYMDQAIWASKRLQSAQCWASEWNYNVSVVEPFVYEGTHLGVPIDSEQNLHETLKFGDIVDIDAWNSGNPGHYPKLVSWHDFMQNAPRDTIIVQIVYNRDYRCTENEHTEQECGFNLLNKFFSEVLARRKFVVIKRVCVNFKWFQSLAVEEFNQLIFHGVPEELPITIVFDEWRGTPRNVNFIACFIQVEGRKCSVLDSTLTESKNHIMVPSIRIEENRRAYVSRYLNARTGYVAVLIRWEKVILWDFYKKSWDSLFHRYTGAGCVQQIVDYVKGVYSKEGISTSFISTDLGRYGSSTFSLYKNVQTRLDDFAAYTERLVKLLSEDESLTVAEYERRFEEVTGSTNPAVISQLQKAIAASARCLLLVGAGSFQDHTLSLYKQQAGQKLCYKIIQTC